MPTVCASFTGGCPGYATGGGSVSYPPGVNVDPQAVGGTTCQTTFSNYSGNTDLNPPGMSAIRFYNSFRKANLMTIQCGVNGYVAGRTAAQEYTSILSLVSAAKAQGYTVIVATMTDSCHIYLGGAEVTYAQALNDAINGGAVANGYTVADYAADANIGVAGASQSGTYFQTPEAGCATGGVHLKASGVAIQATIMEAAMAGVSFP